MFECSHVIDIYAILSCHPFYYYPVYLNLLFLLIYDNVVPCSDRFLPDKAIDLIDEAGSRVRLQHAQVYIICLPSTISSSFYF